MTLEDVSNGFSTKNYYIELGAFRIDTTSLKTLYYDKNSNMLILDDLDGNHITIDKIQGYSILFKGMKG